MVDAWIIYPWEPYETILKVVRRAGEEDLEVLRRVFVDELGLSGRLFEKAARSASKG